MLSSLPLSGGAIEVGLEEQEGQMALKVQDSGRGIHPDDLPHVFDRFYQSSRPDAPKEGGTGIGLSLSMEFAKLMKGKLWAESELGKGAIFYFEFPKKAVDSHQSAVRQSAVGSREDRSREGADLGLMPVLATGEKENRLSEEEWKKAGPFKILLVEDNENLRSYIQLIIGEKYEVETAENGKGRLGMANGRKNNQQSTTNN